MWVDDRYTLLTGNNLNPRAFRLDLENGLLIDGTVNVPKGEIVVRELPPSTVKVSDDTVIVGQQATDSPRHDGRLGIVG